MSEHKYEVRMTNGDRAEADTLESMLLAAVTMRADSGGRSLPGSVLVHGRYPEWALVAAHEHIQETEATP